MLPRLCLLQCFSLIFDLAAPCMYYYPITTHVSPNSHVFILSPHSFPPRKHIFAQVPSVEAALLCAAAGSNLPYHLLWCSWSIVEKLHPSPACISVAEEQTHTQLSALQASLCIITRHISLYYNKKKVIHIHVIMLSDRVDKILQPC